MAAEQRADRGPRYRFDGSRLRRPRPRVAATKYKKIFKKSIILKLVKS